MKDPIASQFLDKKPKEDKNTDLCNQCRENAEWNDLGGYPIFG